VNAADERIVVVVRILTRALEVIRDYDSTDPNAVAPTRIAAEALTEAAIAANRRSP
jgi:hypothetical protein